MPRISNIYLWFVLQDFLKPMALFFMLFGFSDYLLLKIGLYDDRRIADGAPIQ